MTKAEAISQMKAGKKITHRHFSNNEWMSSDSTGRQYTLEDGVKCSSDEFWKWRTNESWNEDFEIFNETK